MFPLNEVLTACILATLPHRKLFHFSEDSCRATKLNIGSFKGFTNENAFDSPLSNPNQFPRNAQ